MTFFEALTVAAVPSLAAVITAWVGFRDFRMRRRLETSKRFLELFATAHGRPTDGRDGVGVGEQVATLHLIADFARKDKLLLNATTEGLQHFTTWQQARGGVAASDGAKEVAAAASKALNRLQ